MVYLNAGDGPVEAVEAEEMMMGESKSKALIEAVAEKAAQEEIDPFGSLHASVDYQRHLAKVLTSRALEVAFQRATLNENGNGGGES